jgi:hypothetical protein
LRSPRALYHEGEEDIENGEIYNTFLPFVLFYFTTFFIYFPYVLFHITDNYCHYYHHGYFYLLYLPYYYSYLFFHYCALYAHGFTPTGNEEDEAEEEQIDGLDVNKRLNDRHDDNYHYNYHYHLHHDTVAIVTAYFNGSQRQAINEQTTTAIAYGLDGFMSHALIFDMGDEEEEEEQLNGPDEQAIYEQLHHAGNGDHNADADDGRRGAVWCGLVHSGVRGPYGGPSPGRPPVRRVRPAAAAAASGRPTPRGREGRLPRLSASGPEGCKHDLRQLRALQHQRADHGCDCIRP